MNPLQSSTLRPACGADLDALCQLESISFEGDRFTRRQLAHLLNRAHAHTWVAVTEQGTLQGYGTLLFRRNSRSARLYSFCVHPEARGTGLGRRLLEALEGEALERGMQRLTLEVRADNRVAMGLYRRMGFLPRRWLEDYYVDGCAAWQMDKALSEAGEAPRETLEAAPAARFG
ncbi:MULTISPECIES: GNAT family N-acetyltransferase [Halomonadaceae]|uniref:N-acetyltransferase domain-containing protein n=1 Tax=Modicisalibacter zincidurans TaxID=1178777 RepID=A0ABP9RMH3_9GAMM|nr:MULTISPECIES: GNAT family N-acetyltransferase [Halomonas]MCD6009139.1 GNAT family N-acetyltransferase [Halomonas sp. IOP_31]MEA3253088.1 GNAT family N-acetyltransferase [Pseudomonadota bacterium]